MSEHALVDFVLVLDCSLSMDAAFGESTRRAVARQASWDAVRLLQRAPKCGSIRVAQVLFEDIATIHLYPTPVCLVRHEHLGCHEFSDIGGTNILASLRACERTLWPNIQQKVVRNGSENVLQSLVRLILPHREFVPSAPLPHLTGDAHVLIVSDGEHNRGGTENDCVLQAERLKRVGARIYAHGIGDPASFGLLQQLVSNPRTDFGVHQSPASLHRTFRTIAQGLILSR